MLILNRSTSIESIEVCSSMWIKGLALVAANATTVDLKLASNDLCQRYLNSFNSQESCSSEDSTSNSHFIAHRRHSHDLRAC